MSDPAFVAAAYAIVIGGLSLYVISTTRRVRAARRATEALERARERALPGVPRDQAARPASRPSQARR